MGKHKKTSGSGYINGSVNEKGGYVEAGGNLKHGSNGTTVNVNGNINHTQPFKGKGRTGGGVTIGITTDF